MVAKPSIDRAFGIDATYCVTGSVAGPRLPSYCGFRRLLRDCAVDERVLPLFSWSAVSFFAKSSLRTVTALSHFVAEM
jgi:hypothetical protein